MKRSEVHRRADRLRPPPGRKRHPVGDVCRQLGRQRSDLLHLEKEVRASGRERAAPAAAAGGGEWPTETAGRRPLARQAHAVGGPAKKSLRPARRRELAAWFHETFQVSCLRACRLAQFGRASWYRRSRAKDQTALRLRIRELAHARPRFGYMRIWVLLRREGWLVNRKRVRRLVSPGWLTAAHAGAAPQAHRPASWAGPDPDRADRALEHGFRP